MKNITRKADIRNFSEQQELIYRNARFGGYKIKRYEKLTNKEFQVSDFYEGSTFVSGGKLYYFLIYCHSDIISSFFELNTDTKECLNGNCGVYFEIIKSRK